MQRPTALSSSRCSGSARCSKQVTNACLRSSATSSCKRSARNFSPAATPISRRSMVGTLLTMGSPLLSGGLVAASPVAAAAAGGEAASGKELLVVGPGVLGSYLGRLWKESFPGAAVVGLTNTANSHDRLTKMGLTPHTKDTLPADAKFSYVAFCAPPSGSADYVAEIKSALARWDGTGSFAFTSSMGVCPVDDGSVVKEDCPTAPLGAGPSTDRLLGAEAAVREAGGNVVRLVGLYHCQRGAHTYFLKIKDVPRPEGYVVNLLHYEDAAGITAAVLRGDGSGPFRGRVFLGCDNHPVTFKDMMAACIDSGVFQGAVNFTAPKDSPSKGKRADNSATRAELGGWRPKYDSFQAFMAAGGKDYYTTSGLF